MTPESLGQRWQRFKADPPGRRFRELHARSRGGGDLSRAAGLVGGTLITLAGLILMPAPGPGMPVVAAGAMLLAAQSSTAARALDWTELRVRRLARRFRIRA